MRLMLNYIQKIDLFGQLISLNYKGLPYYQTKIGGIFTSMLLGLFVTAIYFFSKEIFEKRNPISIFTSQYTEKPESFNVTWESFPFAVALEDGNTSIHYLNEKIFKVSMVNQIRRRILNTTSNAYYVKVDEIPIPIGPCTVSDLSGNPNTINYWKIQNWDRMYCIKHHLVQQPIFLEGTFVNEVYKTITIRIAPCQNTTESQECLPIEDINRKLNAGYFQIQFTDTLVDLQDKDNVFKYNGRDLFTFVSNLNYKNIQFYLKHVNIKTDKGWIFEDSEEENGIAFANIFELADPRPKQNFVQIQLRIFTQRDTYKRYYKKIQDVLAQIGGLLNSLLIILGFILVPISKLKFYKSLINQLFVFKSQDNNNDQDDNHDVNGDGEIQLLSPTKQQKMQELDQLQQSDQINNTGKKAFGRGQTFLVENFKSVKTKSFERTKTKKLSFKKQSSNKVQQKFNNKDTGNEAILQVQNGGFKLKFHEYIMFYLCPCGKIKKKKQHLYNSIAKIENRLDPIYILNKLNELDKIKILLLNTNQLRLFQYLPKPVINFDESAQNKVENSQVHEYWSLLQDKETHHEKAFKAFLAYHQICEGKIENLDKKLIEMMEPCVKTVFDKARLRIQEEQKAQTIQAKQLETQQISQVEQTKNQLIANYDHVSISLSNICQDSPRNQALQIPNKNINALEANKTSAYNFYEN